MQNPLIEYTVIGVYLVLLVAIGAVVKRFNQNDSDYFRNGCKGTWWLVGASAFMTQFSAWTFTGASGAAYDAGWSVMVIFFANAAGFLVGAVGVSGWFRQLRVVTVPEAIRMRFGPGTQQFYAWLSVVTGLLYASLWLYGLALFCSAVFNFDMTTVILVIGAVVLLYSTAGGSWAVMTTDFLQTLILIPITLLIAYLCLEQLGGVSGMFRSINEQGLSQEFALINTSGEHTGRNDYTWVWAAAFFLKQIVGMNTLTSSQRYFGVKTGRDACKASALAAVLMVLGALVWFIPPITGRLLFSTEIDAMMVPKPAETSYAVVSMKLLPVGLTGLMVVAMLSATMSSMDSGLNRNAAIFTRDILPALTRLVGKTFDPLKPRLRLAQVSSLAFGLMIVGLTLYFAAQDGKGVFELMLDIGSMLALPLAVPMALAIFIRRAPGWSALVSIATAFVFSALGFYKVAIPGLDWLQWTFAQVVFINVAAGAVGFLATVPFWNTAPPAYREKVDLFFETMHRPIDFALEVGPGNDLSQLKIIGWFAVIIGGFVCLLAALPQHDLHGRLAILFVGGFVAGFGVLFIWLGQGWRRPVGRRRRAARHLHPSPESPRMTLLHCRSRCGRFVGTARRLPALLLVLATAVATPALAADTKVPYDVEAFRPVLDASKLQAPTSSPAKIDQGDFAGKSNEYFFLDDTGTRLTFSVSGDSKRSELRQLSGDWDTATTTPQRLIARVKVFRPETRELKQFTFMQIHDKKDGDHGLNKPLLRLAWRASRSSKKDHLWAAIRTPEGSHEADHHQEPGLGVGRPRPAPRRPFRRRDPRAERDDEGHPRRKDEGRQRRQLLERFEQLLQGRGLQPGSGHLEGRVRGAALRVVRRHGVRPRRFRV